MELANRSLRGLRALSNDPMLGPYQQQDLEEGNDEFETNVEQPQQNNGGVLTIGPTSDIVIDFENGLSLQTPPMSGPQSQDEITTFRGNEVIQGLEVVDDGHNKALENILGIFLYGVVKWNTVSGFLLMITIFSLKLNISPLYVPLVLCFVDIYGFLNLLQNSPASKYFRNVFSSHLFSSSEKRRHQFNVLQNFLSVASKMALVFYVYLQNFRLIYAFAPTLIFDTLFALILAFKYKNHSLKWFYYLQLIFKICFMAFVGSVALRVDNLIDWNWRETFLGFWVFYALMAGFTLVAILAFFDKFLNFFLPERRNHELYGLLWLVLVGAGTCIFSAFSVIKLQKVLDNKEDLENLMVPFIATSIYNMGTVFYTTSHFVQIKMFFDKLFVLEEENDQTPVANNNQQGENPKQLNSPTKLVIPRFLAKSSNTYFRRVTQDDIDKTKNKLNSKPGSAKTKAKKHKSTKSIHNRKHSMDSLQLKKDLHSNGDTPPEDANNDLAVVPETNRDDLRTDRTTSNTLITDRNKPRMRPLNLGRRLPEFGSIGSQYSDRSRAGLMSSQRTTVNFGELTGFHDESVNPGTTTRRVKDQEEEERIPSVILDAMSRQEGSPEKERASLNQIPEEDNIYESTMKYHKRRGHSMYIAPGTTFPGINETLETSSCMGASKIENLETVATSPGIEQSANQQCLICFDKGTDAVFMECGHGGVCYECSLEIWKTTAECFLCRKKITQVLQIDSKQKIGKNIIKVISATQMVLGQEQN